MLWQELAHTNSEDQVGFRGGVRHVMRFASTQPLREVTYHLSVNLPSLLSSM
jgi:hypothetical protein